METKKAKANRNGTQRLTRAQPDRAEQESQNKQIGKRRCRPKKYKAYDYEEAYNHTMDMLEEAEALRLIHEMRCPVYATKTITAGTKMDVEVYPEYTRLPAEIQREPKSREAQRNLNDANSRKECERLINANFTENDCWYTLSYDKWHLPDCLERSQKDAQNWIKRVNRRRKNLNLPPARYVYVIEYGESESKKRKVRCHIHVVMDGALPMEQTLELWTAGQRNHARRLAFDENGLSGLAQYITKDSPTGAKKWCASKGLNRPIEQKNHRTFRRRKVEKIALSPALMCAEMERQYPNHWFIKGEVKWNGFNGQFYLSANMRLRARPGDMVRITGPAEAVEQIPAETTQRLSGKKLQVVDVDDTLGKETVTIKCGGKRYTIPGRAAVVVERTE